MFEHFAIRFSSDVFVATNVARYDLGELLIRLRHYDKAEKVLRAALEEEQSGKRFT